jgi:hypothetical protein
MISRSIEAIRGFLPTGNRLCHSFVGPKTTSDPSILANAKTFEPIRRSRRTIAASRAHQRVGVDFQKETNATGRKGSDRDDSETRRTR